MSEVTTGEDNLKETSGNELALVVPSSGDVAPLAATPPLEMLDSLYIKKKLLGVESTGDDYNSKYIVRKSRESPHPMYHIRDEPGCCWENCIIRSKCCGNAIIDDYDGHTVHLHRSVCCNLCLCCCPPCLSTLTVTSSTGELYGRIRQTRSICTSKLIVENGQGERIFKIKGPCCTKRSTCCGDLEFPIISKSTGEQIGTIYRKWNDEPLREAKTYQDHLEISFPVDLDVKMKMVLLAAAIFIDFDLCECPKDSNFRLFCDACCLLHCWLPIGPVMLVS